jgi:deazaflavin-dependent oxidoreductase (nitroreductase family)
MLLRAPIWFYRNGFGRLFGDRLVYIVHIGRKTGRRREAVAEVVWHDRTTPEIVVIAAWGREPDWYRNLRAAPAAEIRIGARQWIEPRHRFLDDAAALAVLKSYRRDHPRAWRRIAPVLGFPVDLDLETLPTVHAIAFRPAEREAANSPRRRSSPAR